MAVESERPLLEDFGRQVAGLATDVQELLAMRWHLARLEIESDVGAAKRLAATAGIAAVTGLTGLPLAACCAAELLDGWWGVSRVGWLALLGSGLIAVALLVGWTGWRRFRRDVLGLRETLAELREDLLWMQEWTDRDG